MQTLSSGRTPAPQEPAALVLEPFRAVRYSPGRVSGLAEVTSPPYDVIGPANVGSLLAADPHNVVRLTLPQVNGAGPDGRHGDVAVTLREWLDAGVLVPDPEPALYAYEQSVSGDGTGGDTPNGSKGLNGRVLQRGLIGAVKLSPPGAGVVLPHEDVMPGPVTGRRQLMETAQANLEPIFLLRHGGQGAASRLLDEIAATWPPLMAPVTEDGLTHRLWAITDQDELDAIAADLAHGRALIADGHHRYAAYLELQARKRAAGAGPGPWDYGLALLVDAAAYPPRIDAIHRVIPGLPAGEAVAAAARAFRVRPVTGGLAEGLAVLREAGRDGAAFLVAGAGIAALLTDPDPDQVAAAMPRGRSPHWRGLPASILQRLLLGQVWGIRDEEPGVRVIHHDAYMTLQAADETGGTALICNPMTAQDVRGVATGGERVPRKSTSFGPKPRTGLVLRTFNAG